MSKLEFSREFIYTLPESIFLDNELTLTDMRVYMIIRSFMDSHRDCFASNAWFAKKLEKTSRQIIYSLNKLESKKFIIRSEHNNTRTLEIQRNPLNMIDDEKFMGGEENFTPHEENFTGGCKNIQGGGEENFIHSSIVVKDRGQKLLLPSKDHILNKYPHSEPVVVLTDSLTSTPKVNPLNPVDRVVATTDSELLAAYRAKPVFSENILCEKDFLSACDYMIKDRGDIPLRGRIKGLVGLVLSGNFDEPQEWARKQRNAKNRIKGDAQQKLNEEMTRKNAPILTNAKGQSENLIEIMSKINRNKSETTTEPVYKESTFEKNSQNLNKQWKKIELPDSEQEIMFQPSMALIEEDKKEEEELPEAWEARL